MLLKQNSHINHTLSIRGSITLESIIMVPVLLILMMLFVQLIQITGKQIALQSTVSEVSRQLSANWLLVETAENQVPENWKSYLSHTAGFLDSSQMLRLKAVDDLKQSTLIRIVEPIVHHYTEPGLKLKNLSITKLKLPSKNQDITEIELSYKVKILLPFITKELVLVASSKEKVWRIL